MSGALRRNETEWNGNGCRVCNAGATCCAISLTSGCSKDFSVLPAKGLTSNRRQNVANAKGNEMAGMRIT